MRHVETGACHGVVRKVATTGYVVEGSFKDGLEHGLVRTIYRGAVVLGLYEEGRELASLTLNADLVERCRNDPDFLLTGLNVESLKLQ